MNNETEKNPLDIQIGGDHYKSLEYQPIEFFRDVHLDVFRANIIKYLARWRKKGGLEDLKKAQHYALLAHKARCEDWGKCKKFMAQFPESDARTMWHTLMGNFNVVVDSLKIEIACGGYAAEKPKEEPVYAAKEAK